MPRYIDADAPRKQISETYEYEFPTASGGFDEFATKIIPNIINNATTADVVPVVRGEWTSLTECSNEGVYCSVCHKKVWKADYAICAKTNKIRSNYCPNCGAKMESEGNQ